MYQIKHKFVSTEYFTYQSAEGSLLLGIKIYNHLPRELKQLSNDQKSFGLALKRFLCANSFYAMNEYFNYICTHIWEFGYMLFYVLLYILIVISHIYCVFFISNVHVWLLHYCKCIIYCDGNHIHDVFLKDLWWTNKWMNE
jgi:hypothetical protein